MTAIDPKALSLPVGWTSEPLAHSSGYLLIHAPDGCMVTVSFDERRFRGGLSSAGPTQSPLAGPRERTGRGWRQALVDDAVAWLSEVTK